MIFSLSVVALSPSISAALFWTPRQRASVGPVAVLLDDVHRYSAVQQHAAPDERVANNPLFLEDMTPWPVNISWALFADRASCFAGRELALPYTALRRDRLAEIKAQFKRVFEGTEQPNDVRDMATRYQCRVVVLTTQDPAWQHDPFSDSPYYKLVDERGDAWRIYRVTEASMQAAAPNDR